MMNRTRRCSHERDLMTQQWTITWIKLRRLLLASLCLLILRVTVSVLLSYKDYLPPDFLTGFLNGRQSYFFGPYRWAFYVHIASGPCSLLLGMVLLSDPFRMRWPKWHRKLGKIQVVCVLLLVAPSGLWMSAYADSGVVAGIGFGTLALATGLSAAIGWRSAVKRQFANHCDWMWRCYLLLCSAVVLRIIGGLATVMAVESAWAYPVAAWASWLGPLSVFEALRIGNVARSATK